MPGPGGEALLEEVRERLELEENWEKAFSLAEEALSIFKASGNQKGVADVLREIGNAHRTKSSAMADLRDKDKQEATLDEGRARLEKELASFKDAGDRYGEASMLLALVDIDADRPEPSPQSLEEGLTSLSRARTLFKELGEKKMEGQACILIASVQSKRKVWKKSRDAGLDALALFQGCSDKKGEGRAYHILAVGIVQAPSTSSTSEALAEGLEYAQKALVLFQELGLKKSEASLLYFVAKWYLLLGKPKEALPMAKQAMEVFRGLNYGKGWQAESRRTVVTALMEMYRWKEARKVAWEGINEFRSSGDKRCLVLALDCLIIMHLEASVEHKGDMVEAMQVAEEGITVCRELGDKKWEANQIFNTAQIHVRDKNWNAAEQAVLEAARLDDETEEILERAVKLQLLVDVYFRMANYEKALKVACEVRDTYQGKDKRQEEAGALLLVAQCYAAQEDLQRAVASASEAQALFQEQEDRRGEAQAWDLVSKLQRAAGQADEAVKSLDTVKALQATAGDKKAQAYALQQSAGIFAAESRFSDAVRAAFEALALARACDDAKVEVEMLMLASQALLGELMNRLKEAEDKGKELNPAHFQKTEAKALRYAREAVTLGRKNGDDYFTAGAIYATSQIHLLAGRADAGIRSALEAEDLWRQCHNIGGSAYALLLVAEGYFAKADVKQAEEQANAALRIFQEQGEKDGEDKAYEALARFKEGPLRRPETAAVLPLEHEEADSAAAADVAPAFKAMPMEVAVKMARETALLAIGTEDEDVDMDSPLMDVGLDSLSAIAFREQLISNSGLNVPSSLVFDYPSLQSIAEHLVEMSTEQPAKM